MATAKKTNDTASSSTKLRRFCSRLNNSHRVSGQNHQFNDGKCSCERGMRTCSPCESPLTQESHDVRVVELSHQRRLPLEVVLHVGRGFLLQHLHSHHREGLRRQQARRSGEKRKIEDGVMIGTVLRARDLFRFLHFFFRLWQARMQMKRRTAAANAVRMMTMTDME
ncbi:hypothetical protein EYF80_010857 [Liparis tanakae]|uniref:Uncharacterized protein n=1 Tax=Liparis tanakae TaxID=230148 RepID=A0A4Z2IMC3_9TELE|nr:hypothetical protein EYF80_010857 [Liparis tanakae]